jgi:4-hydroxy-3-methylbut-2-en-1-yl diphosphate synthase IspG/GcpE
MKVICKKCSPNEEIEIPDFKQSDKSKLQKSAIKLPLLSIKYLIDNYQVSLTNAKYMTNHINRIYGHCNRCKFDKLDEEYINCPKCGALNFNWKLEE